MMTFYRGLIAQESGDTTTIDHDMSLVEQAMTLSFWDAGWQELQDGCITKEGKDIIHRLEFSRMRRLEGC